MKRPRSLRLWAVVFAFLYAGSVWALYPALKQEMPLPQLTLFDERDGEVAVSEELKSLGTGPALLVPVFTKCRMSCPVLVQALKSAINAASQTKGGSLRVLILSFDSSDTAADLKAFRERERIPADWGIARARDQASVREFFDQYSYSIMDSDGGFAHPSQVLVLNRDFKWVGSILGPSIKEKEISEAHEKASASEESGFFAEICKVPSHPEFLLGFGTLGFLASMTVVLRVIARRRPKLSLGK